MKLNGYRRSAALDACSSLFERQRVGAFVMKNSKLIQLSDITYYSFDGVKHFQTMKCRAVDLISRDSQFVDV